MTLLSKTHSREKAWQRLLLFIKATGSHNNTLLLGLRLLPLLITTLKRQRRRDS
jgi:hypothetical protein